MKRLVSTVWRYLLSSLLTAGFLVIALLILQPYLPTGLSSPATAPPASPTPSTMTIITNTLSYSDALQTYKEIATCAIEASERAVSAIRWVVGAVITLATVATGAAAYLYKTAWAAERSAQEARDAAISARDKLDDLSERYLALYERYIELRGETRALNEALLALDRGEMEYSEVEALHQLHSLDKWIRDGDDLGWHELQEMVRFAGGLSPAARRAVEKELQRVQQEARKTGGQTEEQREREQRLRSLLARSQGKRQ